MGIKAAGDESGYKRGSCATVSVVARVSAEANAAEMVYQDVKKVKDFDGAIARANSVLLQKLEAKDVMATMMVCHAILHRVWFTRIIMLYISSIVVYVHSYVRIQCECTIIVPCPSSPI